MRSRERATIMGAHRAQPKERPMRPSYILPFAAILAFATPAIQAADGDDKREEHRELKKEEKEHPRLAAAIRQLDEAIDELRKAPHDFGGHREDAIKACEQARDQLKQALDYRADGDKK
jgi:hypothetical protein